MAQSEVKNLSEKHILLNNFIVYFVVSCIALLIYGRSFYPPNIGIQILSVYFIILLATVVYQQFQLHYPKNFILHSFLSNIIFLLIAWGIILDLNFKYVFYPFDYASSYNAYGAWYTFIGIILFMYVFRYKIKDFSKNAIKKSRSGVTFSFKLVKKHGLKATLIPYFLEWWTVRKLQNNYRAVYFAKKFIIIQAKPIKASLPGLLPSTVSASVKDIFQNDIDRMHQLFKYNHITTYSKTASLKFVMKVAEPIIKDLQLTLEQHLTEELLKESNSSKNLSIDVDTLWKKIEKIMTNWQSTFTDGEFQYKDDLLIK